MTSLNPVHTVGSQIAEALTTHFDMSTREAKARVVELLDQVGIRSARGRLTTRISSLEACASAR